MKKIAFVAHLSEISGSGVALLETVSGLSSDYEAHLILPAAGPLVDRAVDKHILPVIIPNPQFAITEANLARKLSIAAARIKYVQRLQQFFRSNHISLVYVNTSASIFPAVAAKLAGIPIAWHIHETLDGNDRRTKWKKRIIRRWANGLIYASNSRMQCLPPPPATPSLVARNCIRTAELASIKSARLACREATLSSAHVLVMNGTIARKGADILLRALIVLQTSRPHLKVQLVITGSPAANLDFAALLNELGESPELKGRINYPGIQNSLGPLLAGASLFISPARNEALPIAIVEAMAAGVPVIATDVGDCADLLNHGQCGWIVPPENPEAMAAAIAEALAQPEVSIAKAEAAFSKVMADYGSPQFWQPLKSFLNLLMGEGTK